MSDQQYDRKILSGLWQKDLKDGGKFLTGVDRESGVAYSVFRNNRKKAPNSPDFLLYSKPLEAAQDQPQRGAVRQAPAKKAPPSNDDSWPS